MVHVNEIIKLTKCKSVSVYGFGNGFNTLKVAVLDKYNIDVDHVFDIKAENTLKVNKWYLHNPRKISKLRASLSNTVIISIGDKAIFESLKKKLKRYFPYIFWAFEIIQYHFIFSTPQEISYSSNIIFNEESSITRVENLLSDSESIRIYRKVISFYRKKSDARIQLSQFHQYFDKCLIDFSLVQSICICGGFDEKCITNVNENGSDVTNLFVFEPCKTHYKTLTNQTTNFENIKNLVNLPIAVGKELSNGFLDENGTNSHLSIVPTNQSVVVNSIDNMFKFCEIDYFTIDVEGFENDVIEGARNYIEKNSPIMAIAVYHRIDDIWQIPGRIYSINPTYKFYIRNYSGYITETIVYAIPRSKLIKRNIEGLNN